MATRLSDILAKTSDTDQAPQQTFRMSQISDPTPYDAVAVKDSNLIPEEKKRGVWDGISDWLGRAMAKPLARTVTSQLPATPDTLWQVGLDIVRDLAKKQAIADGAVFGRSEEEFKARTPEQQARIDASNNIIRTMDRAEKVSQVVREDYLKNAENPLIARDYRTFHGSFMENPSWARAFATVFESAPMLGIAATATIATKNPRAGAAILGTIESSPVYLEMRKQGFTMEQSAGMLGLNIAVISALETIPMEGFLKGGGLLQRSARGAVTEGLVEEPLQNTWMNAVEKLGWNDSKSLWDGLVESVIGGVGSGGMIGALSPSNAQKTDDLVKKAEESGLDIGTLTEAVRIAVETNSTAIRDNIEQKLAESRMESEGGAVVAEETTEEVKQPITTNVDTKSIARSIVDVYSEQHKAEAESRIGFDGDQVQRDKFLKQSEKERSSVTRALEGKPTETEVSKERERLNESYVGKVVNTPKGQGTIVGVTDKGNVRVEIDGKVRKFKKTEVTSDKATKEQAIASLKVNAERKASSFLKLKGINYNPMSVLKSEALKYNTKTDFSRANSGTDQAKIDRAWEDADTDRAIIEATNLADRLGVKIDSIDRSNQARQLDWNNPDDRVILEKHGITKEDYDETINDGSAIEIDGEHSYDKKSGRSSITIHNSGTRRTVLHELLHAVRRQGLLTEWSGSEELIADEFAKMLENKDLTRIKSIRVGKSGLIIERKGGNESTIKFNQIPGVIATDNAVAVSQYSIRTVEKTKQDFIKANEKTGTYTAEQINKFFSDIDNVARFILANKDILDYVSASEFSALKKNADPQYKLSLDFTTMCIKRYMMQATVDAIQMNVGRPLTAEEFMKVRQDLDKMSRKKGSTIETSCGACYVDSRRIHMATVINKALKGYTQQIGSVLVHDKDGNLFFQGSRQELNQYKKDFPDDSFEGLQETIVKDPVNIPKLKVPKEYLLTMDGIQKMAKDYPKEYKRFRKLFGGTQMKIPEGRTEYKGEIAKLGKDIIDHMNRASGMRWQSWSDFEIQHLLDGMQAIMDMSQKGLKGQAYTKVVEFVRAYAPTGMMINMSFIPKGNGFDADGNLVFDERQSFPMKEALEFRKQFDNVGIVAIGISDEHIAALLADPRIDYVIPYHASGLSSEYMKMLGMDTWQDYTDEQMWKKGKEIADGHPYINDWKGDLDVLDAMAEEQGLTPPFLRMREWKGYEKLLTDRRIFGRNGKYAEQRAVRPEFDMKAIEDMLRKKKVARTDAVDSVVDKMTEELQYSIKKVSKEERAIREDVVTETPKETKSVARGVEKESRVFLRAREKFKQFAKEAEVNYTTIQISDQVARAEQMSVRNPEEFRNIALGFSPSPIGIVDTGINIVYAEQMLERGNGDEAARAIRNWTLIQSARGQQIVMEKARATNVHDAQSFIQQVIDAKIQQAGKKIYELKQTTERKGSAGKAVVEKIKADVKKGKTMLEQKRLDIAEAQKIIEALRCR